MSTDWHRSANERRLMDPATVDTKVRRIGKLVASKDLSGAALAEYQLYVLLLASIAEGKCQSPANCAAVALRTQAIDMPRWPGKSRPGAADGR